MLAAGPRKLRIHAECDGMKAEASISVEPILYEIRIMPDTEVSYINFWSNSTSVSNRNRLSELQNAGLEDFSPSD
jgi:hypothetical protein